MHSVATKRRHDDLVCRRNNARLQLGTLSQVRVDVFDHDGRVINQNTDRERQSAQRHDIDRLPGVVQHQDRATESRAESMSPRSSVERQLPRNSSTVIPVKSAAVIIS